MSSDFGLDFAVEWRARYRRDPATTQMMKRCKRCRKPFDAFDPGDRWGRQPFCCGCVRAAGLGEFVGNVPLLEENVEFGFVESLLRWQRSRFWISTAITGMLFTAYMLSGLFAGGRFPQLGLLKFTLLFIPFLGIPWGLVCASSTPRRRKIWVENGKLMERTENWFGSRLLADRTLAIARPASWAILRHATEIHGPIWEQQTIQVFPSIVRDANACGTTPIVCGYSEDYRRLWAGYFTLCDLRRIADPYPAFCVILGPLIGVTAGISMAVAVEAFTGNANWVVPLTALGYIDGLLVGTVLAMAFAERTAGLRRWIHSHPLTSAAIVIGVAIVSGGWSGALGGAAQITGCRVLNLVLGSALWAYLFSRGALAAPTTRDAAND